MAENEKKKMTKKSDKNKNKKDTRKKGSADKRSELKDKEIKPQPVKEPKPPMSDEKKQRIVGLAVIGVITAALLISGIVGVPDSSIPAASDASSIDTEADGDLPTDVNDSDAPSGGDSSSEVNDSTTTAAAADDETSSQATDGQTSGDETAQSTSSETEATETDGEQPQVTDAPATKPQVTEAPSTKPSATKTTTTAKQAAKTTTTTAAKKPAPSGGLSVRCEASNSWTDGTSTFTQVDIYIKNDTSEDISGWAVKVTVPSGAAVDSSWNGKFSVSGTTLSIKPDGNDIVYKGQETNIGCIIKASDKFEPTATLE